MSLAACTNEDDLFWQEGQNGVFPVMCSLDANDVISRNVWSGSNGITVQITKMVCVGEPMITRYTYHSCYFEIFTEYPYLSKVTIFN